MSAGEVEVDVGPERWSRVMFASSFVTEVSCKYALGGEADFAFLDAFAVRSD